MAHLSHRDQLSPEGPFLRNAEMIVHGFTDDGRIDAIGPSLTDEMFDSGHHSLFINQNSKEDSAFEGYAGLTDCLDSLYGRC
jgi:hypothetical protein